MFSSERLTAALGKAHQHWESTHEHPDSDGPERFSIAVSREAGTYGAAIAREIGARLGWPVYDRELLQQIADDIGVHRKLLESVDERQDSWLRECIGSLFSNPGVNQTLYFRRLVEVLLTLANHGECVIVGRGATTVLPLVTTLRVRVVAPLEHRVQAVQQEHGISHHAATERVEKTDRERNQFVVHHFGIDPADPANYDLGVNTERFSTMECADMVLNALERLRRHSKMDLPAVPATA